MAEQEYLELKSQLDKIEKMLAATKEILSLEECANLINLSTSRLYALTSVGEIPFYKPMGGKIYFKRSEIEEWIFKERCSTNKEIESMATTHCVTHRR